MSNQGPKPERFQPLCHFPLPVKVVTRDCHSVTWAWPLLRASAMLLSVCLSVYPGISDSSDSPLNSNGKFAVVPLWTLNSEPFTNLRLFPSSACLFRDRDMCIYSRLTSKSYSLCSQGCPWTSVAPAPPSWVLGLQAHIITLFYLDVCMYMYDCSVFLYAKGHQIPL